MLIEKSKNAAAINDEDTIEMAAANAFYKQTDKTRHEKLGPENTKHASHYQKIVCILHNDRN
jgi:hypothetical protein